LPDFLIVGVLVKSGISTLFQKESVDLGPVLYLKILHRGNFFADHED
jgi:hypothetical protein